MTLKRIVLTFLLSLIFVGTVQAQTALNTTTLSTAVTSTATTVLTVASNTGATANTTGLWMNGEFMPITATSGSTSVTVRRGQGGLPAVLHPANSYVWIGPMRAFTTVDPGGSCTAGSSGFSPFINIANRVHWNCINSLWQGWAAWNASPSKPRKSLTGLTVSGGGELPYAVLPTDDIVVLSTTSTGCGCVAGSSSVNKSIVLPSHLGLAGKQITIVDESGGISATTSIVLVGTINGTHSSVANVVQLKTAFSAVVLHAGSGGWFLDSCSVPATNVGVATVCR